MLHSLLHHPFVNLLKLLLRFGFIMLASILDHKIGDSIFVSADLFGFVREITSAARIHSVELFPQIWGIYGSIFVNFFFVEALLVSIPTMHQLSKAES